MDWGGGMAPAAPLTTPMGMEMIVESCSFTLLLILSIATFTLFDCFTIVNQGWQSHRRGSAIFVMTTKLRCDVILYSSGRQARRKGGAEGVIARGPGDTEGPWVQNCQDRMQNYGLRTLLVYLGGAIVLCTPSPF